MSFDSKPASSKASKKIVWGSRSASFDVDLRCAAGSKGGVLITGPSDEAQAVAMEIHRQGDAQQPFDVVDCADPDCLKTLDRRDRADGGTLLLRDVDRLSPLLQAKLFAQFGDRSRRIMAQASECPKDTLEATLFYRLNTVYIDLAPTG